MKIDLPTFDLAASAAFLLFGIYVLTQAASFGITSDTGPGSGTFPMVAGLMIAICSALNLIKGLRRKASDTPGDDVLDQPIPLAEVAKVFAIVGLIGIYLLLFKTLGPFLHLPVLMVAISLIIHRRTDLRWLLTIFGISVLFSGACYLIFAVFLRVLLPEGPLGF